MTRLLLIDDDDTTREVLRMLLEADGWQVTEAASGEAAVALASVDRPDVVLSDLQMPGLCGPALAAALRTVCGAGTVLLAMTATRRAEVAEGYSGLLVKPFPARAVREAARGAVPMAAEADTNTPVLALDVLHRMLAAMPAMQVRALYEFALEDAERRVSSMETATDDATLRAEAHALKGSCSMVGALRLGALAGDAEVSGAVPSSTKSKMFSDFRGELLALRRMLEEQIPSDK